MLIQGLWCPASVRQECPRRNDREERQSLGQQNRRDADRGCHREECTEK